MRVPFSFLARPASGYDPAILSLTGWWRATSAYAGGSPWPGVASAGGSGSQNLSEATNPPGVGSTIDGLKGPLFDGTNDVLTGATAGTFLGSGTWTVGALFRVAAFTTSAAKTSAYLNSPLVSDTSENWGLHFGSPSGTGKLFAYQWDGAVKAAEATIVASKWYLAIAGNDGTTLSLVVNAVTGTPQNRTGGSWTGAGGALRVGGQSTRFGNVEIRELLLANTAGAFTYSNLASYVAARHPSISLT